MSNQHNSGKSRLQTMLLAAIAGLLAVDVGHRFIGSDSVGATTDSDMLQVAYQPEVEGGLANPLRQRQQMIDQLKSVDRRLSSIESQLKGKLRVEVLNFPQPKADGKD
ncbi:MAG: hypothetical protein KDA31_02335 [Phycisphaerales bacterium]|nr:hypothetical protein [Phycisphaerales bacterium]MCB9835668.1 hypothetical protein [Phycisphaera sp.]